MKECDDAERDADAWEVEFLASIAKQHAAGHSLSPKQRAKLEAVHARLTAHGASEAATDDD